MAHDARVLYVGTFSKSLGAGRQGFVVLPGALVEAFARGRALSDRHSPGAPQDVLARLIEGGHLLRHLRRMRELYRARQASMIHDLARASGGALTLDAVMTGWMASDGHCANLTNPKFNQVGLVCVPGTAANTYNTYWTMDVATSR